jgi:hypothetical protein
VARECLIDALWARILPRPPHTRCRWRCTHRLFLELRAHMEASEQATYDRTIEQLKDMLGDDDYEAAYRVGQALALEESLKLALGPRPRAHA